MSSFSDKLKLKEKAEEDTYFARRDRELIEALHRKRGHQDQQRPAAVAGIRVKIVSGGQTGVDRAALDVALELGLEAGGWCPRARRAEDGRIAVRYPLRETPSGVYSQRTEWNVRDSDATLILHRGAMSGGTRLTAEIAARLERPLLALDLAREPDPEGARAWLLEYQVRVLNVAGPREEGAPGVYAQAFLFLRKLLILKTAVDRFVPESRS